MTKEKIKIENTQDEPTSKEGKVGTMLKDVRVKKKIELENVAEKLRIKLSYLEAIETSDYSNIPPAPYGVGFVRSYASYLGLNSERIVQIFKEETSPSSSIVIPTVSTETEEIITEDDTTTINHKYIAMSVVLLILCYLLWLTITPNSNNETSLNNEISTTTETNNEQDYPLQVENFSEETENSVEDNAITETQQITITDAVFEDTEENIKTESSDKVAEEKIIEEKTAETKTETETETVAAPKEDKDKDKDKDKEITPSNTSTPKKTGRVVLKIKKETWVEVKDENKLWISKVLQAGDEYVLPENGVGKTVSFGNTDGVDVLIDGKAVTVISNNKKTNINMDAFLGNH